MAINNANEAQSGPDVTKAEIVGVTIKNMEVAPMEETRLTVLLEITGDDKGSNRLGLDIVAVLDVTSMGKKDLRLKKFNEMRKAMKSLIDKLEPIDCLSIVTFSGETATTELLLRNMTENNKNEIDEMLVNRLLAVNESENGVSLKSANVVVDGLQQALQVLDKRTPTTSRVSAIMLVMGTCEPQSATREAIYALQIPECNVPVYTFGLGPMYNEEVLCIIASKSKGGTFSTADVQETLKCNSLKSAFSRCLSLLLTIVANDVKLTITSTVNSEILSVSTEDYWKPEDKTLNSVTVSLGNINCKEKRKVLVDLLLPAVQSTEVVRVLEITYSYNNGEVVEGAPLFAIVDRAKTSLFQEKDEVTIEEVRLGWVAALGEILVMAEDGQFNEAQNKIVEDQIMLEHFVDQPNGSTIDLLKFEMFDLLMLLQSKSIYVTRGRAFALATLTSQARQRAHNVVSYNKIEPPLPPKPENLADLVRHLEKAIMLLEMMQRKVNTYHQVIMQ